ncbi:WhiB family transcriptional regulator [Natronoglycomyces albus]|uniref:Transcriptional regulator WhiB n=1 Tax=Natronoglycomyces albus TaxID=2811108 RepID=A0A895XV49_9ACTN|nr:WhiB family transcriptional regulator [Natronoglycomyces albus]QSB07139.1 WhiB family transcriptional regulator [Natronoglycomyces albus]
MANRTVPVPGLPPVPKCARPGVRPEAWFPLSEESSEVTAASMRYARALCAGCPVVAECLETALTTGEDYGIWGGLTSPERRQILTARTTMDLLIPRLTAEENVAVAA